MIVLGARHLRHALTEFVVHDHAERNHQGLDNDLIQPLPRTEVSGPVRRRQRMGGMLNYYYLAAWKTRCGANEFSDTTGCGIRPNGTSRIECFGCTVAGNDMASLSSAPRSLTLPQSHSRY